MTWIILSLVCDTGPISPFLWKHRAGGLWLCTLHNNAVFGMYILPPCFAWLSRPYWSCSKTGINAISHTPMYAMRCTMHSFQIAICRILSFHAALREGQFMLRVITKAKIKAQTMKTNINTSLVENLSSTTTNPSPPSRTCLLHFDIWLIGRLQGINSP